MAYSPRDYYLQVNPQTPFMTVVETVRSHLCPNSPGVQSLKTGDYSFFDQAMRYVKHYVEPASGKPANRVKAVKLTTRASPATVESLRAELAGQT